MSLRLSVVVCSLGLILYSAASLFASSPRVSWECCSGPGDCDVGEKCCSPDEVGLPSCDGGDYPGYCMSACVPGKR
jgi:hypothetical protein